MDRYNVVVLYADGTTSALATDALNAAEAKQDIIGRLAEQLIEWPPQCCPQILDFSAGARRAIVQPVWMIPTPQSARVRLGQRERAVAGVAD